MTTQLTKRSIKVTREGFNLKEFKRCVEVLK
jgi:hypothetical protein